MFNHTTTPVRSAGRLTRMRSALSERREARAARRALETELGRYRTPAEVEDLFAALRTEDDANAEKMRSILFSNLASHQYRTAA